MSTLTQEFIVVPVPMSSEQIVEDITARIEAGEYPAGTRLPSYAALAELYTISTSTAYRIYKTLKDSGLVVGSDGRGMYVVDAPRV